MVRRWSYLNNLNNFFFIKSSKKPVVFTQVSHLLNFKITTYYRKRMFFPDITKIIRKNFFRRKHLNNWIVYQNIITFWAKEYLFFKKYSKILLALFLWKNNYIMNNLLLIKKFNTNSLLKLNKVTVTTFLKKLLVFCNSNISNMLFFNQKFKGINWFFLSSYKSITYKGISENFILARNNNFLTNIKHKQNSFNLNLVFNIYFKNILAYNTAFYKILILLFYKNFIVLFLRKSYQSSGGSRNIVKLTSKWLDKNKFNQLTWRKSSKAGRGQSGRVILWTKGTILKRLRYPKINYSFRWTLISFISTFYLIPFQNKLLALCFLSNGAVTYLQTTNSFKVFSFFKFFDKKNRYVLKRINSLIFILINIKLFSRISLLELYPGSGVQYARSSGVFAKFIKINWLNHTGIIQLPSGVRKAFSLYSITSLGAVSLRDKRLVRNTKAGFYKSYGLKSKVRGVAMNPIDHPHGGRTKAIKNQRTPWGKPTKLK